MAAQPYAALPQDLGPHHQSGAIPGQPDNPGAARKSWQTIKIETSAKPGNFRHFHTLAALCERRHRVWQGRLPDAPGLRCKLKSSRKVLLVAC